MNPRRRVRDRAVSISVVMIDARLTGLVAAEYHYVRIAWLISELG